MRHTMIALFAAATVAGACEEEKTPLVPSAETLAHAAHEPPVPLVAETHQGVARVREATARFHDIAVAAAAGYDEQWPAGCAASPQGAQAYHYLDRSLLDGKVELERPELLMYEPQADGSLRLIGVDYFIPFDQWTETDPPRLLGQNFMPNEALHAWTLHIWAWRHNPGGMFAAWNPRVSCRYAD